VAKLRLTVICKACGTEFEAPLRLDRRSFEKGTLAANYHTCPHCGERQTYRKADYIVADAGSQTRSPKP
jgi:DNA-directed RNA polymerase subunit RPC12/RpoP